VVKIIDWGKYRYEQAKQEAKNRKNQKQTEVKQIRMGLKIGEHDIDVKLKSARKFLEEGNTVKLTVRFRGREITHPELGHALLDRVFAKISDVAEKESAPAMTGRDLSMIIKKKKESPNA
jgi:translation initiation factor IF-3